MFDFGRSKRKKYEKNKISLARNKVARPKFRATTTPVRSWNTDSESTSAANLTAGLDKQLSEASSRVTIQPKKWSPSQPVEVKKIEIADLPSPQLGCFWFCTSF